MADATLGIEVKGQGIQETSRDLDKLSASARNAAQASTQITQPATATAKAFNTVDAAAKGLTDSHTKATTATKLFRESVHALDPVLQSSGLEFGRLGGFARAAQIGVVGLATVLGASLIVAAEATAQRIRALRNDIINFS